MAVRIITDSASDISQETAKQWNIKVIPMHVRFGKEEFLDGVTLSNQEFYERLNAADQLPKTSQITPAEYEAEFEAAKESDDSVICFCLSSGVSGSYQSACLAAEEYKGTAYVIDTRQFCVSQYIQVQRAVQLRDEGKSAEEIVSILENEKTDSHVVAIFDTLEYLKMGGRINPVLALAGTILSIKPLLTIEDGVVKILAKVKGMKRGHALMTEWVQKLGGIDYSRPFCFAYTGISDEKMRDYIGNTNLLEDQDKENAPITKVGATIGTYAGPGAIAVAFFSKHHE